MGDDDDNGGGSNAVPLEKVHDSFVGGERRNASRVNTV